MPPSSTETPNAAVRTPAVLSAIRSSPAQPEGARRFRSSTRCSSARAAARPIRRLSARRREALVLPPRARRCRGSGRSPSSSPARCVSRGRMSIRQQKCSAPAGRGAHPQVQRRASAELARAAAAARRAAARRRSARRPRSARAARRGASMQLERQARRVRRHQHRLVVDRDDALALAHLLLHEVAEQVAAHRARRVGAEALALARDRGGHEVAARRAARACAAARRRPRGAR